MKHAVTQRALVDSGKIVAKSSISPNPNLRSSILESGCFGVCFRVSSEAHLALLSFGHVVSASAKVTARRYDHETLSLAMLFECVPALANWRYKAISDAISLFLAEGHSLP